MRGFSPKTLHSIRWGSSTLSWKLRNAAAGLRGLARTLAASDQSKRLDGDHRLRRMSLLSNTVRSLAMNRLLPIAALSLVLASPSVLAKGKVDCNLRFDLKGWSVLYKTASGTGTITCDNGQKMDVIVSSKGGGLSVGKQKNVSDANRLRFQGGGDG